MIVGKGISYADAHHEIKDFVENTNIPYLVTPMAKGTISDDHPQFVGTA